MNVTHTKDSSGKLRAKNVGELPYLVFADELKSPKFIILKGHALVAYKKQERAYKRKLKCLKELSKRSKTTLG